MRAELVTIESLVDLLQLCIEKAAKVVPHLRVDLTVPTDLYSAGLLLAILDHARAVTALANSRSYPAIPIITRSCLEAYVDLVNLSDNPVYWRYLDAIDTVEWQAFFKAAKRGDNISLAPLTNDPVFEEGRALYAQQAQELGALKIKKLKVWQRFERAGMTHEYEGVYAMLCAEAHNNVSNLRSRYFTATEERADAGGHRYELPCTLTMSELTLKATEKLLRHCGHGTAMLSEADAALLRMHEIFKQTVESHN